MIYNIVYDAVKKKSQTEIPNNLIGNVEMAAGIGMVLKELKQTMDFSEIEEPIHIKESFERIIDKTDKGELSEGTVIIIGMIEKYQVKGLVNETMEDLRILVNDYGKM